MISFEELIQEITRFFEIEGRSPHGSELKYDRKTYRRRFGSFNNALEIAGVPINKASNRPYIDYICAECGKGFKSKQKSAKYCCKPCSMASLNRSKIKHGKNTANKKCVECDNEHSRSSEFCGFICRSINEQKSITVGEMSRYSQQNKYRAIRDKCHNFYKHYGKVYSCQRCGYDKHVEICHIRPVSEFDVSETVWDCNKPSNILFLCPNCHWEFDNGLLELSEVQEKTKL